MSQRPGIRPHGRTLLPLFAVPTAMHECRVARAFEARELDPQAPSERMNFGSSETANKTLSWHKGDPPKSWAI
eukprot:gene23299-biopygen11821